MSNNITTVITSNIATISDLTVIANIHTILNNTAYMSVTSMLFYVIIIVAGVGVVRGGLDISTFVSVFVSVSVLLIYVVDLG